MFKDLAVLQAENNFTLKCEGGVNTVVSAITIVTERVRVFSAYSFNSSSCLQVITC